MSRHTALATLLVSFLIFSSLLFVSVKPVKSAHVIIMVPDGFPTIQGAIDNATSGDIVFVRSGVYHGAIVVNKAVSLIGQDQITTIIDADGADTAILINSDYVTVNGFTVQDTSSFSIYVLSSYCFLSNNTLIGNSINNEGIFLDGRTAYVYGNTLTNNSILNSGDCGILVWAATNNYITSNIVRDGTFVGIFLFGNAVLNQIKQNNVDGNLDGGVVFDLDCSNNILVNNNITNNGWRPLVWKSGIVLNLNCGENQIVSNYVSNNQRGILQYYGSNNNLIYHNSFINNHVQVYDDPNQPCSNIWDSGYPWGGNYWSDYSHVDQLKGPYQNITGSDGIGDVPYTINPSNVDHYPLMKPYAPLFGDVNNDGKVNMVDIGIVATCFGTCIGEPGYNPQADINQDGKIDLRDIALVAKHFEP